jgi:hypothetical protein
MATEFEYTIRGQQVITKKQLTDAEIDEIAASLPKTGGITPKELSRVFQRNRPQDTGASTTDYLADVTKRAVANVVPQVMRAVGGMEAPMQMPSTQPALTQQIEQQVIQPVQQRSQQALGYQQIPPPDTGSRLIGAGIESALDPVSIASGPGGIVRRVLGGFIPGVTAEFGGQVGQNVAGDTGQVIGALVGGISGGIAQGTIPRTAAMAGQAKPLMQRMRGTVPEEEVLRQADNTVTSIFQAAAQADPKFADALSKSQQISATTGVQLPASAMLNNNPVLGDLIRNLSSRDPAFRNLYGSQFEQAMDTLSGRATRLFGDPTQANTILRNALADIPLDKAQQRKLRGIDTQIAKASQLGVEDQQTIGQRVANLVATKEEEAKKSVAPLYNKAFAFANENNINLPAAGVEDIYQFVTDTKVADKFFPFQRIWNDVSTKFKPTVTQPSALVDEFGRPLSEGGEQVFKAATIEDLDSLKREINRQLRNTKDDNAVRLLSELKTKVDGVINTLPEGFVTQYRAADAAYLNRVGLPFGEEALRQVDRAKFDESIVPVLTKNKSALSQFMDATGEQGADLAMKAFLFDFDKAAVRNGIIDVNAARKWLKSNSSELALLGDKADVIRKAVTDVTELNAQKVRINNAFTEARKGNLLQLEGKTAQDIVNNLYSNPSNVDRFLRTHGSNIDTLNAVRSFMLDDILSAQNPVEALADRTRKATYDKVFGPTYAKNVENLAEAARRLSVNPADVKFNVKEVPTTPIEQLVGVPPEEIISKLRNPIASTTWAVSSILSKFWAKQTAAATDEKLKTLLLDPKSTRILSEALTPKADGTLDLTAAKRLVDLGKKAGIDWTTMVIDDAARGAARAIPAIQAGMPEEMQ